MYYSQANLQKYSIGKQYDIAIALGAAATSATNFYSLKEFTPPAPTGPTMIEDATGNRSTSSTAIIGDREFPFSGSGTVEVDKIGLFLNLIMGTNTVAQDGTTGAYQWNFSAQNNVVLPVFTTFFSAGAEGYRRLTGCQLSKLSLTVGAAEATFAFDGLALNEDNSTNDASTLASLGFTGITYQTSTGLIRYTCASSPSLTGINNGDVLEVPTTVTGVTNAVNKGQFVVVSIDNTAKTIDVINSARTDASLDETSLTTSTVSLVHKLNVPTYASPTAILMRRHSAVKDATTSGGLAAATAYGLRSFSIDINNNSKYIKESAKSNLPSAIVATNISISAKHTLIMNGTQAAKALAIREGEAVMYAWQYDLEDTTKYVGTSTNYRPLLRVVIPSAMGIASRSKFGGKDEITYDWALHVVGDQAVTMVLQNAKASY